MSRSMPLTSRFRGTTSALLAGGNRRQPRRRHPDQRVSHGDLIGQSDPVTSISYYNAESRQHAAGRGLAGHPRRRHRRPVPDHRHVGRQRPAVRRAHRRRRRHELRRQLPGAHDHQRLRPRQPRRRRSAARRQLQDRQRRRSTASSSRARPPTSPKPATTARSTIPARQYNYVHSTMGGLAVGNADGPEANLPARHRPRLPLQRRPEHVPDRHRLSRLDEHHRLRHLVQRRHELHDLRRLQRWLGDRRATDRPRLLVDYDSATGLFSHWTSFDYPNGPVGQDFVTHFEGISSVEKGVYTLSADSVQSRHRATPSRARSSRVRRNTDGTFGHATWVNLNYPGAHGPHQRQLGLRQPGGRDRHRELRHLSSRRRSTSASSSRTSSAATAATASGSTGPPTTRSP